MHLHDTIIEIHRERQRVYICGNGGSATNAIHIGNDLISVGVRAHALSADIATVTAIANDFGYEHVFSRQLEVFANEGDMLILLSGSGRSPNIIEAARAGVRNKMLIEAIVGDFSNIDELRKHVTDSNIIRVGSTMQMAEEFQLQMGHELMRSVRDGK